jgi:arylsulfatase A-like enzyme
MEIPEPETFHDDYSTRDVAAGAEDMKLEVSLEPDYPDLPGHLDQEGRKRWIYQRMMKDRMRTLVAVDENLGRVLDYLEAEGLAEDTLVVYTSDHGYFLGEHGWYDKRFMYDPSIRIPLVACYPRLCPSGAVSEALVMNIDFAPTILDFAGVPIPEGMQGKSLRGILQGTLPEDWRRSVYYAYFDRTWGVDDTHRPDDAVEKFDYFTAHRIGPHRGLRTDRYKLIEYHAEGDYWELFDLQSDPHELHNRYHDPLLSEIRASLEEELLRLRKLYR